MTLILAVGGVKKLAISASEAAGVVTGFFGVYGVDELLFFSPDGHRVITATQEGLGDHILSLGGVQPQWLSRGWSSHKLLAVADQAPRALSVESGPG